MLNFSRFLQDQMILRTDSHTTPIISVIMPTYCRGQVSLRRAIESVLNQTFRDFELIIVDDGSRDGTFDILKDYQKRDPRIVIVRHHLNCGLPALRVDEGILISRGEYISYQFDDDEWLPDSLAQLYGTIKKQSGPCLVYGNCAVQRKMTDGSVTHAVFGKPFNYGLLMNGNYIANNSVMHHKCIFEDCGLYDPHVVIRRFSDYDLWLRMAKKVPFIWIDQTVSKGFAGADRSLGTEVNFRLPHIRKYLEIPRDHLLTPERIYEYAVDDIKVLTSYKSNEIDYLQRFELIPWRQKVTYYFRDFEGHMANISRPRIRTLAVTKGDYSTSVDVTIRNFVHRIADHFPWRYFFIKESDLSATETHDYDLMALYRTIGKSASDVLQKNKLNRIPTLYVMDDNMFKFYELGEDFSYLSPGTDYYRQLEKQITECDLVLSYNPIITRDCQKYNQKVCELKTNIPSRYVHSIKNSTHQRLKFALFSGPVRKSELAFLWPVLLDISRRYKEKIEFHFWGIDPNEFGKLECPVFHRPFTHSYDNYLNALANSVFHYHICPLDGRLDAVLSKSPIKFLEGTVAGAVGIFSDVKPYDSIPEELCFKAANNQREWLETLERAIHFKEEERLEIWNKARKYVLKTYSTESQVHAFLAALEAAELQSRLQGQGIAYFFHEPFLGGATLHLLKHALFAQRYGFPVVACLPKLRKGVNDLPDLLKKQGIELHYLDYVSDVRYYQPDALQSAWAEDIAGWLLANNVGLAHSVTYNPVVGLACQKNHIPHLATLHQYYPSHFPREIAKTEPLVDFIHSSSNRYAAQWSETLGVPARRVCSPVDEDFFGYYERNIKRIGEEKKTINILLSGTIQERKNQFAAINAVRLLKDRGYDIKLDIVGYNEIQAVKEYVNQCKKAITEHKLEREVEIWGFQKNPQRFYDGRADILLCSSSDESMPQTVLQAMAAGVLVVATEVGGVKEIIKDLYNGILAGGTDSPSLAEAIEKAITRSAAERIEMVKNAFDSVRMLSEPHFVCAELLNAYNEAFHRKKTQRVLSVAELQPIGRAAANIKGSCSKPLLPAPLVDMQERAKKRKGFSVQTSPTFLNDVFYYVYRNKNRGKGIIEVGCFNGGASIVLAYLCKIFDWPFYTMDINRQHLEHTKELLSELGLDRNATFFLGPLAKFADTIELSVAPVLAFIDGDHSYQAVKNDITALYKLKQRPYAAAFHDFSLRSHNPLHKDILVDKAVFDCFGYDVEYQRIGVQFDQNPVPSKEKPSPSGSYWKRNGSEGVIIELVNYEIGLH